MGKLKTLKPLEILFKLPNPGIKGGGNTKNGPNWNILGLNLCENRWKIKKLGEPPFPPLSNGPGYVLSSIISVWNGHGVLKRLFWLIKLWDLIMVNTMTDYRSKSWLTMVNNHGLITNCIKIYGTWSVSN